MKKIFLLSLISISLTACVSQKKFDALTRQFEDLQADFNNQSKTLNDCQNALEAIKTERQELATQVEALEKNKKEIEKALAKKQDEYNQLSQSYNALEANSSKVLAENAQQNRALLKELETKKTALAEEQKRLEQLQKDLDYRAQRIDELEQMIVANKEKMKALKDKLSSALINFEDRGLSVEQRDGKVYVSMENKLLFKSGSWTVGAEGQAAVQELGKVLADNPDIAVLIEGHTDNVPYNGSGQLKDNWDLSTKRATEVLKLLLQNENIEPERLTAAGRGKYAPVAPNTTQSGKAKNRRIEVVLTPQLDEISQLLKQN
ncbi:chemotaxis protein MotB [Psychroflexus salarius]|uniref:Chemotaxis protein MotB n=1 Tax=Psychroflexus salarius TaxID=1155689 RepID=A0A1M4V3S3_9FLAO|nr:OmpA family protein [Psychroflexus salarius]SHE63579.1 chemotaxis protein MotB [Psychroflexus salarius]